MLGANHPLTRQLESWFSGRLDRTTTALLAERRAFALPASPLFPATKPENTTPQFQSFLDEEWLQIQENSRQQRIEKRPWFNSLSVGATRTLEPSSLLERDELLVETESPMAVTEKRHEAYSFLR